MTTEQARNFTTQALEQLTKALNQGHSGALKQYLAVMSRFRKYSWSNVLLIYTQRPDATRVAGFHAWLKMRRFVRKGEKGIVILAPLVGRKKSQSPELEEDTETRVYGFRTAYIFDLSQTDGEPLPEFPTTTGDPKDMTDRLRNFIQAKEIVLVEDNRIAPAQGMSSGGKITILPGLGPATEFSVLVHEIAHELLHKNERRHETSHAVRETEAEAVAFVVATGIGLDTGTSASDYIQLHSGDGTILAESLGNIQRAASEIWAALVPDSESLIAGAP
jgi:hypothetical protein